MASTCLQRFCCDEASGCALALEGPLKSPTEAGRPETSSLPGKRPKVIRFSLALQHTTVPLSRLKYGYGALPGKLREGFEIISRPSCSPQSPHEHTADCGLACDAKDDAETRRTTFACHHRSGSAYQICKVRLLSAHQTHLTYTDLMNHWVAVKELKGCRELFW